MATPNAAIRAANLYDGALLNDAGLAELALEAEGETAIAVSGDVPEIVQQWVDKRRPLFETNYDPNASFIADAGLTVDASSVSYLA